LGLNITFNCNAFVFAYNRYFLSVPVYISDMKIAIAQIKSELGNIDINLSKHKLWVNKSAESGADFIVFPEMSLTGYMLKNASNYVLDIHDERLKELQDLSDRLNIGIAAGMPTASAQQVLISMMIFQPAAQPTIYSKQYIHSDEAPYFAPGHEQMIIETGGLRVIPAICYESLQEEHWQQAAESGADLYMASVVKGAAGFDKAMGFYARMAQKYGMHVVMSNATGVYDGLTALGNSAAWNSEACRMGVLDQHSEGVLIYDVDGQETVELY